jgi:hypothetical protein
MEYLQRAVNIFLRSWLSIWSPLRPSAYRKARQQKDGTSHETIVTTRQIHKQ